MNHTEANWTTQEIEKTEKSANVKSRLKISWSPAKSCDIVENQRYGSKSKNHVEGVLEKRKNKEFEV